MNIDHIGIVVKDIQKDVDFWTNAFGYRQKTEVVINTRQKVKVIFLEKENSIDIKLIEPVGDGSSIAKFSEKGGGLHHLCFKCDDINNQIVDLKSKGLRLIAKPQPGEAFQDELIAFLMGKNGVNVELIDTDKRAARIS